MINVPSIKIFSTKTTMPLADSSINGWPVELRPLIDRTCFEFINISYFVVCYFQRRIFNTTKLLNNVVPSIKLIMQIWPISKSFWGHLYRIWHKENCSVIGNIDTAGWVMFEMFVSVYLLFSSLNDLKQTKQHITEAHINTTKEQQSYLT